MVGTIVSLAVAAAGAIASAVGSKKANDKRQAALNENKAYSNALYDSEIYQDPTKRSDNQAYLKLLDKKMKRANEVASSKNKILGGTHEQTLAQNQTAADAYSNAITDMASKTSQRRDMLLQQRRQEQRGYEQQQLDIDTARIQNWANLANNAAQIGASAISSFDGGGGSAKDNTGSQNKSNELSSGGQK